MAIITVSRLTGSGGREIATATANRLGFRLIDRDGMDAVIRQQFPMRLEELARLKQDRRACAEMVRSAIAEVVGKDSVVILGSGAQFLLVKVLAALHVQIVAPLPYRIAQVMRLAKVDREAAEKIIAARDEEKRSFIEHLYSADWRDPAHYDLVLNLDRFSNEVAVQMLLEAAKTKGIEGRRVELPSALGEGILPAKLDVAEPAGTSTKEVPWPEFAHPSEREFARVMDFYRIRWEYEPRTFPIEWDETNKIVAAFTPDFYLPDLDLYIELTTMKQSLVTKKNRKLRLLRELYPEVNIKMLYERDYRNLIWKYGLREPDGDENDGRKAG